MRTPNGEAAAGAVAILALILVVAALWFGGAMVLWNWIVPDITGLPEITFWQAAGLTILGTLITGPSGGSTD